MPAALAGAPRGVQRMGKLAQSLLDRIEAGLAAKAAAACDAKLALHAARRAARLERKRAAALRRAGGHAIRCSLCGLPVKAGHLASCKSNFTVPRAMQPLGADEEEGRLWNSKWISAPVEPPAPVPRYSPRSR